VDTVTVRELRNHGGEVLDRVVRGETLIVTRDGAAVAELAPLRRPARSTVDLIASRRTLPRMDLRRLREDLDRILDPAL
jgi:prevent-host-death family protein